MNSLHIIGNLTGDPELRTTTTGKDVCGFTVAVNRRKRIEGQPEADFFRVSVWGELGKVCQKYLAKGRKVSVVGSVSGRTYTKNNGETGVSLDVMADDVEFLTPRGSTQDDVGGGFTQVDVADNPFA